MANAPSHYRPWRVLAIFAVLVGGLVGWAFWPGASTNAPRLGLDLQGGSQVTLLPKAATGQTGAVTQDQLNQAVEIIRARIDGLGVAESEVTIQGSGSNAAIVVSVPGQVSEQRLVELVGRTALLNFRPVENVVDPAAAEGTKKQPTLPVQAKTNSEAFQTAYSKLDCTLPENNSGGQTNDPELWLATCDTDGTAKYILQPSFIEGTNITDASAQLNAQTNAWSVSLTMDSAGAKKLAEVSTAIYQNTSPQNQFAIVLDSVVVNSPYFKEPIGGGQASIDGTFTAAEAQDLANVLKYGSLPISLEVAQHSTLSPTLGIKFLHAGLLAGAIGLALVALYLLAYYRALGIVAVVSLGLAGLISYCLFVVLGRTLGFTLTLAGIAGAIVSIGVTADSFIVYFERIRDEIREGRTLRVAAETGWIRARRTLLAADFVSLLGAVVLYVLSVGSVRGFAFALGITTLADVFIAFVFTRPVVSLLSHTAWFRSGSKWTGVDPHRLGLDYETAAAIKVASAAGRH
ncbi:MAG: protein translocase subunit SecD [Candidatus Nanopelagicales bacterium]